MHTQTHTHTGRASLVAQTVKNLSAMRETCVQSMSWGDPRWRKWQPTPVFLPGEPPWTEEPGGLYPMESQSWTQLSDSAHSTHTHTRKMPYALKAEINRGDASRRWERDQLIPQSQTFGFQTMRQ